MRKLLDYWLEALLALCIFFIVASQLHCKQKAPSEDIPEGTVGTEARCVAISDNPFISPNVLLERYYVDKNGKKTLCPAKRRYQSIEECLKEEEKWRKNVNKSLGKKK